jgi:hypothetical protein
MKKAIERGEYPLLPRIMAGYPIYSQVQIPSEVDRQYTIQMNQHELQIL